MPPKVTPKCVECDKSETLLWRTVEQGQICQECYERKENEKNQETIDATKGTAEKSKEAREKDVKETPESKSTAATSAADEKRLRKSTRSTRFKRSAAVSSSVHSNGNGTNTPSTGGGKAPNKGRNRRNLFKKTPFKTPVGQATTHSVNSLFYKGSYLQVGDIVSLSDNEQNVYYGQIRGLLVDNYCEKSAYLTWLIPTQESPDPREAFDAATYLIGPDEGSSRKLSCLEFVMHAPSNYYLDRTTPFPLPDSMEYDCKPGGYIWTTLPEYQRKKVAA